MFAYLWQRLLNKRKSWTANGGRLQPGRSRVRLQLERLEDRVTPSGVNVTAVVHGTTLDLTETSSVGISSGQGILIQGNSLPVGSVTVQTPTGDTINGEMTGGGGTFGIFTTGPAAITAVKITLGSGADKLDLANLNLTGALTISGTGGDKTVNAGGSFGSLSLNFQGNGSETSTFTSVDVAGAATINHPGTGDTSLTISSSNNSGHNWGSLTVTNGQGLDTTAIGDTSFAKNLTINNGAGGSFTNISATNDANLTNIGGNLTINTTSGQSDSELYDYNVHGNVTITTGTGTAGQENFVGLENIQTFSTSGIPVISGNVTITGSTPASGHLDVVAGTDLGDPMVNGGAGAAADLPLTILGNLTINATGPAQTPRPVFVDLNDLNVPNGTTTITLGAGTQGNTVDVQAGISLTSVYNNFTVVSSSSGNGISIQDQGGTTVFHGKVDVQLKVGTTGTIFLAADAGNDAGVGSGGGAVAEVFFWEQTTFKANVPGNKFYGKANSGSFNTNIFFAEEPTTTNFLLV